MRWKIEGKNRKGGKIVATVRANTQAEVEQLAAQRGVTIDSIQPYPEAETVVADAAPASAEPTSPAEAPHAAEHRHDHDPEHAATHEVAAEAYPEPVAEPTADEAEPEAQDPPPVYPPAEADAEEEPSPYAGAYPADEPAEADTYAADANAPVIAHEREPADVEEPNPVAAERPTPGLRRKPAGAGGRGVVPPSQPPREMNRPASASRIAPPASLAASAASAYATPSPSASTAGSGGGAGWLFIGLFYLIGLGLEGIGWAKFVLAALQIRVDGDRFDASSAANVAANEAARMDGRLRFLNEQLVNGVCVVAGLLVLIFAAVLQLRSALLRRRGD